MRNGQNKRMRGRNRSKGHHGHHHNPLTRVYESNGPDVKIRGTAHHVAEKYLQLARDAAGSGDPVTAENYYQHAEHYFRLIAAAQDQFRQQNPYYQAPPAPGEGNRDEAFDDDGDDTGGQQPYPPREQPQPPYGGQPQPHQGRPQQFQPQQQPQPFQPRQPEPQPAPIEMSDGEQLPSFVTGASQQQAAPANGQNGYDPQGGGERFPRHRRRRHRGPRQDQQHSPQDFRGDGGADDSRPG